MHFLRQISHQWISFKENNDFNKSFAVYDYFMTNSITPYLQIDTSKLIERVDIDYNGKQWDITIKGEISALVSLAQNAKNPPKGGLNHDVLASSTKMVAGVGLNLGRTKSW